MDTTATTVAKTRNCLLVYECLCAEYVNMVSISCAVLMSCVDYAMPKPYIEQHLRRNVMQRVISKKFT